MIKGTKSVSVGTLIKALRRATLRTISCYNLYLFDWREVWDFGLFQNTRLYRNNHYRVLGLGRGG